MATLSVRNVGPIREADIEIKKHTVFIGPQGSGKSTLAKLIAISCEEDICLVPKHREAVSNYDDTIRSFQYKYDLIPFIQENSFFCFTDKTYKIEQQQYFPRFELTEYGKELNEQQLKKNGSPAIYNLWTFNELLARAANGKPDFKTPLVERLERQAIHTEFYQKFLPQYILLVPSLYIPTERNIFPILSNSIWSLISGNINLPASIKSFGQFFEQARNSNNQFLIPFLNINYKHENGQDLIEYQPGQSISLSQSASGYQAIIPLLLVVEHQRRQAKRRFIIEEPELNLYPTTQKELIYSLISGLDPTAIYQDAEWVFTTHSPYILSSLNTLLLAWKVAHTSDELRAKVEQIIPTRCWINPDEFAAYYVDNGTVESITSPETGLINDSRLDDVSDALADEQDQLRALRRSLSRA
jgi:predicted ATPase